MAGRIGQAFVEHHHDVAAERHLHIDGRLRREQVRIAVQMRAEQHAFLGDLAQSVQTEDLETSRIGQDRPRPGHEPVQPAEFADGLVPRPQE